MLDMRKMLSYLLLGALLVVGLAGCGQQTAAGGGDVKLTLVAYSTPKEAYDEIIPAFQKTEAGKGVTFSTSYGASGAQSRAVASGLQADVVAFSLAPDIDRLVKAGIVSQDWNKDQYKGMVTDSVVVLAVRPGNPKHIKGWDDLIKPGIEVVTPNPFTSGGARWNIMAAYGAQIKAGKSEQKAEQYLKQLFDHVQVQDNSGRESLQTFLNGKGDVAITYENEAINAKQKGEKLDYVVPDQTILIENPVAVTKTTKHPDKAKAFVDFLRSEEAQKIFGQKGYRPVVKSVLSQFDYPTPSGLFTIDDLGGWDTVTQKFFDPEKGVVAEIEKAKGVSVESK